MSLVAGRINVICKPPSQHPSISAWHFILHFGFSRISDLQRHILERQSSVVTVTECRPGSGVYAERAYTPVTPCTVGFTVVSPLPRNQLRSELSLRSGVHAPNSPQTPPPPSSSVPYMRGVCRARGMPIMYALRLDWLRKSAPGLSARRHPPRIARRLDRRRNARPSTRTHVAAAIASLPAPASPLPASPAGTCRAQARCTWLSAFSRSGAVIP